MQSRTAQKITAKIENVRFQTKAPRLGVIARPQSDRGNLKVKGMASRGEAREHEARAYGSTKQKGIPITKNMDSLRRSASSLPSKVLIRPAQPYFVPGCRLVPLKIAASGARALLAMTRLIGFAGNRSNFRNETIENGTIFGTKRLKNGAEPHRAKNNRKNNRKNRKRPFSNKNVPIFVSLRGAQRRGNLKVKGMASRGEAREHEAKGNPYHKKHGFTASFCCLVLYSKVPFHSAQP